VAPQVKSDLSSQSTKRDLPAILLVEREAAYFIPIAGAPKLQIRLFTEEDAQALWDLRMLALETEPWSFVDSPEELQKISVADFAARLRATAAANFIVGAFDDHKPVGMVGFYQEQPLKRRHKGWIWGVFVAPSARGRGVAKSLMLAAIERAKTVTELDMILLTVSAHQPVPRKLYASLGFRSFGIEPGGLKIGPIAKDEENMVLQFSKLV
jgi:ribosomal protein S18 acetylase RimI-like enzyme